MKTIIGQWAREQEKKRHRTDKAVLDAETRDQLETLGYLQ
jgi:hypothetical protein